MTTDQVTSPHAAQRVVYPRGRLEPAAGLLVVELFLAAARTLWAFPAETAVFEDALAGVAAARAGAFGLVVGVDRVGRAHALREHGADLVVSDLSDLLRAA